jgi:hypothetical protein
MLLHWVAEAVSFGQQVGVRTTKTRFAQRLALPLAPHFAELITFMVSPVGGKARLVPLSIAREINRKHILLFIFNGCQYEATQIQLYLQYLTFYHAANITSEEKGQATELSELISQMGYEDRVDNAILGKREVIFTFPKLQLTQGFLHTYIPHVT